MLLNYYLTICLLKFSFNSKDGKCAQNVFTICYEIKTKTCVDLEFDKQLLIIKLKVILILIKIKLLFNLLFKEF